MGCLCQVKKTQVPKESICLAKGNKESISSIMDNELIDTLCDQINSKVNDDDQEKHFADDRNILITANNILSLNEKIQIVKNQLENWFYENRLIINTDKSKVLFSWGSRSIPSTRPLLYK
jgi:hypothetical protein